MPHYQKFQSRSSSKAWESTYAELQVTSVDIVAIDLANGHRRMLMGVHLDKGEATVGLQADLNDIAEDLEERDNVILSGVWRNVTDVDRSLPVRSLRDDGIVAESSRRNRGRPRLMLGLQLGEVGS